MYGHFKWTGVSNRRNGISQEYEPLQPFFLTALAAHTKCRTFLDIGANVGNYSMFASRIPTVERIIAFEANPHAAKQVRANAALNGIAVDVRAVAVSCKVGTADLGIVSRYAGNNAIGSPEAQQHITVPTTTLDSLGALPGPVCLKIDVEGHELQVVEGAKQLLAQPCIVQMERNGDAATDRLRELGYTLLTHIGPDNYLSNIAGLSIVDLYEASAQALIDYNHENKSAALKAGDWSLEVKGRSYWTIRGAATKLLGRRL